MNCLNLTLEKECRLEEFMSGKIFKCAKDICPIGYETARREYMESVDHVKNNGVINFGKMAGKRWSEMRDDYLDFILSEKCYTSRENKEIAKQEKNNRKIIDGQIRMF